MRIVSRCQVMRAIFQNENAGIKGVIRSQEIFRNFNLYGFACTRSQKLCLAITHQFHRCLFNLIGFIILGIRLLCVNLHGLFAFHAAGIGYVHTDRISCFHAAAGLFHAHIGHFKFGIAQAIAKRISYNAVIIKISCFCRAQHLVFITCLGIAVAHINAFLIYHVHIEDTAASFQGAVFICPVIVIAAKVCHCRVQQVVCPPGIWQGTGRIYRTGEDICNCIQAGLSYGANPECCVNSISLVIDKFCGNRICAVYKQHDFGNLSAVFVFFEPFQHAQLVFIRTQVVAVCAVVMIHAL